MYAILNVKTKKYVTGTDWRYRHPHQITSKDGALLFEYAFEVETAFRRRQCGKDYKIVIVEIVLISTIENIAEEVKKEKKVGPSS